MRPAPGGGPRAAREGPGGALEARSGNCRDPETENAGQPGTERDTVPTLPSPLPTPQDRQPGARKTQRNRRVWAENPDEGRSLRRPLVSLALWTRAGNGRSQAQLTSGLGLHIHGRWPPGVLTRNTGWEVSSYWRVRPEMADRRDAGLPKLTRRDRGADFPPAREPTRDSPAGWGRSARAGRRGPFRTECRAPLASALGIGPLSVPWQGLQPRALVTKKMAQSLPLPRCGPNSRIGQSCTTGSHTAPWHRALPLGAS